VKRRVHDELEDAMSCCGGFINDVFELIDDMTSRQIARHFGHQKPWNVEKHLHAIDMIYDPSLAAHHGKQVHTYAKAAVNRMLDMGVSHELADHLHDVLATQPRQSRRDVDNETRPEPHARGTRETTPGVYVYTYPQYLITELLGPDGRTLFKVGASQATEKRLAKQRRQTEVPEDIEIVRVYPSQHCFDDEYHFHTVLSQAGHHHKTTRAGTEWFRTSLPMLDAIAAALNLEASEPYPNNNIEKDTP